MGGVKREIEIIYASKYIVFVWKMSHELDLKVLWKDLDDYTAELDREGRTLQDVWLKIAQIKAKNDQELKE